MIGELLAPLEAWIGLPIVSILLLAIILLLIFKD